MVVVLVVQVVVVDSTFPQQIKKIILSKLVAGTGKNGVIHYEGKTWAKHCILA